MLYNGGEEKRPVTFHYDSDLYFRKDGVALFISPSKGKVAFYTGWPNPAGEVKEAKVYRLDEFWADLDNMAGYVTHGTMTPARALPDAAKVWEAVRATGDSTNQHVSAPRAPAADAPARPAGDGSDPPLSRGFRGIRGYGR